MSARSPLPAGGPLLALSLVLVGCAAPNYRAPDFKAREQEFPAAKTPPFAAGAWNPSQTPAAAPLPEVAPPSTELLGLDEVLASVMERYPPYLSVLLERDLASAGVQQALGAFDTSLSAKAGRNFTGFYEATVLQGLLEQPLWTGGSLYGGYRRTDGLLPDYYDARTQTGGEVAVGGRIPLLRDREIDARRFKLRQEEIKLELADPKIAQGRIDFIYAATRAYNQWVAAGLRLAVARELLGLAQQRVEGIDRGIELQFLAEIDRVDNQRLIVQRQLLLVRAERGLEQAALALSLFLRAADDEPIVPSPERLPRRFAPPLAPEWTRFQSDIQATLPRRPELRRIELLIDGAKASLGLADNQLQPNLDLKLDASQDIDDGPYKDLNDFELFLGLEFKLPVQRREARGRLRQATTELERLDIERGFARDRVIAEVADALSALQASYDQLLQTNRNVDLARQLAQAEQRSFELGRSDLLRINLRESQLADAEISDLEAQLSYHQAAANYRAALAVDAALP